VAQGFSERLQKAGCASLESTVCFDAASPDSSGDHELAAWLVELRLPAAVFAIKDCLAHRLVRVCLAAGLRVPQDIAILGCSNDEFLCTVSQPPISSIALPFAALGYEAAKLLDAAMTSVSVPQKTELPPLGVITRQSTDPAAQAEPALATALRFIRDNATKRIGVDDIAAASGLSRSSLERRFRAVLGRSPLAELLRERLERAQHLLVNSEFSIKEIARAAGFHDVRHLSVTFRQKTGITPGNYRAKFRPG
jgi:LacI family transcriptional regulator